MDKSWMHADRRTLEYDKGVENLLRYGLDNATSTKHIHCPCSKCLNMKKGTVNFVREHLYFYGIDQSYKNWIWHGEPAKSCASREPNHGGFVSETVEMCEGSYEHFHDDPDKFRTFLEEADKPLYGPCGDYAKYTKLSALIKLYNLKAKHGWTDNSFSDALVEFGELLPRGNLLPTSMYEAKKILSKLGSEYEKIHACSNNCILYRKQYIDATSCPKCGLSRWKVTKDDVEKEGVPAKVLWYFPPIPRFKRMFKSCETSRSLTWYAHERVNDGMMRHPADSPAWKLIDHKWPDFASESRNLRLALSADGINPHGSLSNRHSCWPVILVTYNLPPWLCMKRKFMMLTLLISGPKQPGNNIDVYLAPLIDDLKKLWDGVDKVYDSYRHESFTLKAVLLWTINDFPAYGNLSGCTVSGYKACPICGEETYAKRLKHGKKMAFTGHRRFLPRHHPYRKRKAAFNNEQEFGEAPKPLSGEEVLKKVEGIHCEFGKKNNVAAGCSQCWKKRSIFFDLEYWKHLHVRHALDVMHIEKNVCTSIVGTLLNIPGKTKDGVAARLDLIEMGVRLDLKPEIGEKKTFLPPAPSTLSRKEKRRVCSSLLGIKVPQGYSSNIRSFVSMEDLKLFGLKSHDCHVLMQQLLPVAIRSVLPKEVRYAIIRLCFFFNALCHKVVDVSKLDKIQSDLVTTLCLLEMYFPPSFFDIMVHLTVHLIREVRLCGPVFYRWMYPFERYMKVLKGYVQSRHHPEGCIAERYIGEEAVESCSEYLSEVNTIGLQSFHKRAASLNKPLSGACVHTVDRMQWEQAHLNVLANNDDVEPYIELHKLYLQEKYSSKKKCRKWLQDEHNRTFIYWLRDKVADEINHHSKDIADSLRWLAQGPSMSVLKYDAYVCNGCHYHTKALDNTRVVQNSGVSLVAKTMQLASAKDKRPIISDMLYYGVINEIWELDYHKFRLPLFKCEWVKNSKAGIKTDELGFTLVNLNIIGHTSDPFVFPTHVKQVFYVEDPLDDTWSVVLATPDRDYHEYAHDDVLGDTFADHQSFSTGIPSIPEFDDMMEEADIKYKRDDCEGIWVDQFTEKKA